MKITDLYIRVSTDEQADKGYSMRDQEERLRRYCSVNNLSIGQIVKEDHSAKNFNRPEWKKLLSRLKKRSSKTQLLLFTKWDRFSRNAGDAYQMISLLNKLGVEPQAVEQPLNLAIPENKMMLAIYLSAPEVENDRRALNVFHGMRRASKEGRIMGKPPYGYINKSRENGEKYVAIKEPEASKMKWAFHEIAKGIYAADQIRKRINIGSHKKISKSAFHIAVRNPIYCGKVFIKKHKDEEAHFVKGKHEPLISEELFQKVQDVIDKNKREARPNVRSLSDENLPLRGFLICPKCGKNLTGSASKGRSRRYYYYHCVPACGFRHRANVVNSLFEKELKKYEYPCSIKNILKKLLLENYKRYTGNTDNKKKNISDEINALNAKMSVARDKLLSGAIDDEDYRIIKSENKERVEELENQLRKNLIKLKKTSIDSQLDKALKIITNISTTYRESSIETKRFIIGSIYPKKIEFDGSVYRTGRKNVILEYILKINKELQTKKKGNHEGFFHDSRLVLGAGLEPARP